MWSDVIYEVQRIMRGLPGITDAPVDVPDANGASVYSLAYCGPGTARRNSGARHSLQDIVIEVTTPRGAGLPAAIQRLIPFFDLVPAEFLKESNLRLGNTIDAFEDIPNEGILQGDLGQVPVVFIRFRLRNCKRRPAIT